MATLNSTPGTNEARLTWIDPVIVALDVADTANKVTGPGHDGGATPDQTAS